MKYLKNYEKYKESMIIDLQFMSIDILESMNILNDVLLDSIKAEEVDIFSTLKLPTDFYKDRLNLDYLSNNIEFINSLSSLALKKSQLQNTEDYQTFIFKPCKWMFIYDISSNELENPVYVLIETWNDRNESWENIKLFKVNGDSKHFYDKLSSKTVEISDAEDNYIYTTSDGNTWELQNLDNENDVYKRFLLKDEFKKLIDEKKLKISII